MNWSYRKSKSWLRAIEVWNSKTQEERDAITEARARRLERRSQNLRTKNVSIYVLADPDGTPRYVGRSMHMKARLACHLGGGSARRVSDWVECLQNQGLEPRVIILEVCPAREGRRKETRYIRRFLRRFLLLNVCKRAV
jgi:hypothetical protein